jgi:hypothetical protein
VTEEETVDYLEVDQLVQDTSRPVPRRILGGGATAGLWILRVFAIVVSAMVVYTFIAQL